MIERDEVYKDEILLHKKYDQQGKTPKKAKHKHNYIACVFEMNNKWHSLDPVHGFVPKTTLSIGTYCPICGRIGTDNNPEYRERDPNCRGYREIWTEEAQRQFDPETRTLPMFKIDDYWKQKFVDINEVD